MDVVSVSPLRTASVLWQPWPGEWRLTVVAKATCSLLPGESCLADEQEYPNEDDNHWNDDPQRSLYSPSDLSPVKQRADVMLVGHAFAPRGEPVRSLVVHMIIGEIDKAIEVYGERAWSQDGLLREGPRFVKMPLRYERAAGGPGTANPVGMGADARPDAYGNIALPNLQQTGLLVSEPTDFIESMGFGPIAPAWPGRSERLGAYAATFSHSGWSSQPMPHDMDPVYWNAAPRDQQVAALRDNERIILENLHPEIPRLVTSLPGVRPRAFVDRGGAVQDLPMVCDTLWIDTDRSICTLTWRGSFACDSPTQPGRVLIGMETGAQRITWADVQRDHEDMPIETLALSPDSEPGERSPIGGRGVLGDLSAPRPISAPAQVRPALPDPPKSTADASDIAMRRRRQNQTLNTAAMLPGQNPLSTLSPPNQLKNALPFAHSEPAQSRPSAPVAQAAGPNDAMPAWLQRRGLAPAPPPLPSHANASQLLPPIVPQPPAPPPPVQPMQQMQPMQSQASAISAIAPPPSIDSPWAGGSPRAGGDGGASQQGMIAPIPAPAPSAPANVGGSAIAASNAAAASAAAWNIAAPPPIVESAPVARAAPRGPRDVVDLIWFDPESLPPIRANPRWKDLLAELRPDKPRDSGFDFDAPPAEKLEKVVEDRRDVFGVLMRADTTDTEGVNEAIADAVSDDGTFTPPLVLLAGELQFPFDELETLKATVTAVTPLIAGDKKLKETVDTVNELLKTPWLQSSTGVAEGLTSRVKEAFAQGNRMLPPTYLDTHTDRILLEQRHYQKRTVFGEVWIRSLLAVPGSSATIPTYLPEALTKKLPMFQTMRVRMIAEAHAQQDQYEAHPTALRVVALGRLIVTARR